MLKLKLEPHKQRGSCSYYKGIDTLSIILPAASRLHLASYSHFRVARGTGGGPIKNIIANLNW